MKKAIAVVGLGNMGGRIAKRLLQLGHEIGVYDTNLDTLRLFASQGAKTYETLHALAEAHGTILTVLPNADIVREVVLGQAGLAHGMQSGSLLIDMTTSVPAVTQEVACALSEKNIMMIDAPVSGGVRKAEEGTLTIMVGGPEQTLEQARPVLQAIGTNILHVGEIGAGHTAKALNNLITAATLAVTSEALVLGVKMGVDAQKLLDVINAGSGRSAASETKFPQQVLSRAFKPGFSMALMSKDVGIALDMARQVRSPTWVSSAVQQLWEYGVENGRGEMDHTAIALTLEEMAEVEIKAR